MTNKDEKLPLACQGEVCSMCGAQAWHKVGEEELTEPEVVMGIPMRCHNLTAYVCKEHFQQIMDRSGYKRPPVAPLESQWRPISEYDKERGFEQDGWVLLAWQGHFSKEWERCTGQWNGTEFTNGFNPVPATHFMHLPAPPTAE